MLSHPCMSFRPIVAGLAAMAIAAILPRTAAAQDFSAQISPDPVRLVAGGSARSVTVSTTVSGTFVGDIFYSFTGFHPGISTGGTQSTILPYPPLTFTFVAPQEVPRGTYTGSLVETSSAVGTRSFPVTVIVERPDFTLSAMPPSVSVERGGTTSVSVTALPVDGFGGLVSVVSPSLTGLTFDPATFDLPSGGSRAVTVTATPTAPIGPIIGAFVGTASGIAGNRAASLRVEVTAPAAPPPPAQDFSLTATPGSVSLAPGESRTVNVSATGMGGFTGPIATSATSPPGLSVVPASFTLSDGGPQPVTVTASGSAPPGTTPLVFTGTAAGIPGSRTASTSVTVTEPSSAPVITAITPPSLVTGTTDNRLRITGQNFAPGATITSASPGVTVTAAQVLGPGAAEVVVAVRPDARPGPYRLELTNPDGGAATGGAMLLVYPAGALSAPLAVTAAAIVAPRPWQILEPGQSVHAQALLATSGMGTVVGTWLLDGVPFDRFTRIVASGYPVEVRSTIPIPRSFLGEHRLELVIESPPSRPPREVPFFLAAESRTALKVLEPDSGAMIDPEESSFRWTLVPGASGYEVEIEDASSEPSEERPWTSVRRRVTDTDWRPDAHLREVLGPGEKRFRVRAVFPGEVLDEPTPWVPFTLPGPGADEIAPDEAGWRRAPFRPVSTLAPSPAPRARADPVRATEGVGGVEGAGGVQQEGGTRGQLGLSLMSTTTTIASDFEDPPPLTRLQLSTQTDLRNPAFDQQATADLSGSHDLEDPWDAREESRNWLTRLGATQGGFREEFALGFAPPRFFDQTEFLTVATSGGALEGTVRTPAGRLAYYRSVDLSANGSFAGFEPEIDAAAYEAGDQAGRFLFRTMWLRAVDPEVEGFSAGGQGRALGVIGVAHLRPWLRLLGEAAGGDFEPGEGGFEEARDGRAFRLALDGTTGTLGYAFTVGRTGEGFVNPANRGFTPGGVSDRTRAELSLQKAFGRASLSGAYSHVRGGIHEAAGDPGTTEDGASLRFAQPLGQRVSISLGGNVVGQRGDAVDDLGLPGTDRTQKGADLSLNETVGPLSLTQSLSWQDFTDEVQPLSDQTVTGLSFAAGGGLTRYLNLSANVSTTRTEAAPEIGTTHQLLVSLQPALSLSKLWLAVTPRTAWTRVTNDLDDSEFRTDQYQIVLRWSPPWAGALLNLDVASDWNRSWSHLDEPPSFDRRTVLTLSLNWRGDRVWAAEPLSASRPAQMAFHRSESR